MGTATMREKIVLLFDYYHGESKSLHKSFQLAKINYPAVVIEEDGFLPESVMSVYGFFLGDFAKSSRGIGRPRYFNQLEIPDYWEISSSNLSGLVKDKDRTRARIFYSVPTHERFIQTVDWLDEKGNVRYSDHYNRYGAIYARTTFNSQGKRVMKSYFSADGEEIIVENLITRDILLNQNETVRIFNNKTEFVIHVLQEMGFGQHGLYINSLSTPFFVSCSLTGDRKSDILFWHEPVADAIPGNMQMILNGDVPRMKCIYVQKRTAYLRLLELGADPKIVKSKGYVYPFRRENLYRSTALICTNSDQLEQIDGLISALPQVEFHIAALTEMSSKLMGKGKYPNVRLYPGAKLDNIKNLFQKCDIYLDINHGNEIVMAVRRAFLNNQVIYAFRNTLHNENFLPKEQIYQPEDVERMAEDIRTVIANPQQMDLRIQRQLTVAMAESAESFLTM